MHSSDSKKSIHSHAERLADRTAAADVHQNDTTGLPPLLRRSRAPGARVSGALFLAACLLAGTAVAEVPATLNHQGVLKDANGIPLSGNFVITFRLLDAATDGNELWSEMQGVEVTDGLFNVALGSVESLDSLAFDEPYWLGISVNNGPELEPRLPLAAVPYSLKAKSVSAGSLTPADFDPAAGSEGQVLTIDGGQVAWKDPATHGLNAIEQSNGNYRVLLNRTNAIGVEWFGVRAPVTGENQWGGMYMETNGEGIDNARPFYGYAHNGQAMAWHEFHSGSNEWRLILRNSSNSLTTRFKVDGDDGNVYADGTFNPGGADLAESFKVEGESGGYEPGDVLVISTGANRTVALSNETYSTLVAGVYATKPGMLLSQNGASRITVNEVPMAVVGVVPTKVTTEGGPIRRGDLMVTSHIPGHAMRADREKLGFGMVLGKALEDYDGTEPGRIEVLVNVK